MIPPAMTTLSIRIKTGESEFEAEGTAEDVKPQILTFLRLLGREDLASSKPSSSTSTPAPSRLGEVSNLMEVAGRTVSLNGSSGSLDEDVLLLLLGQQQLLGNAAVAGRE